MRYQELDHLFEHNVVNIDAIQKYVGTFAQHCKNEVAAEWFRKTLARHLEQDDDFNKPLQANQRPLNAPQWLDAALERGDDVRAFQEPTELTPIFDHLVDYFNFLADSEDPILNDRRRVMAVTIPVAIKKSEEWVQGDAKKAAKQQVEGVKVVAEYGPFTWVEPTTLDAIWRDGKILQNCLGQGTYHDAWESGQNKLFFLHDGKGQPHVAIRTDKNLNMQEAKGKQNLPPIGRYIALTAEFINEFKLIPSGCRDLKAMGLVVGTDGRVGTVSSFGTKVFEVSGITVVESDAELQEIPGGYNGGLKKVGGGKEYWFCGKEGDLFSINHDREGKIFIASMPEDGIKYRPVIQHFLNEYFGDAAPLPLATDHSSYGRKNALDGINLPYDYLARKYGTTEEVSKEEFKVGDLTGYMRGVSSGRGMTTTCLQMRDGEQGVFSLSIDNQMISTISLDFLYKEGYTNFSQNITNEETIPEAMKYRDAILASLNQLKLPPNATIKANSYDDYWRRVLNIYYNTDTNQYGDVSDVASKLWSKAGITAYDRKEKEDKPLVSYFKGKEIIFEFEHSLDRQTPYGDEKYDKVMKNILITSLNTKAFAWSKEAELLLDEWDVFRDKTGKWNSREAAGEKFHTFDDGGYMTKIMRGGDLITYTAYNGSNEPLISMDIRNRISAVSFKEFQHGRVAASRYFEWLLNSIGFGGEDVVDGGGGNNGYYNNRITAKMALWHMGLFHDSRSDSWKLIQDGKMLYDGGDWRAVNFRNRVFLVDNQKGLLGWFKREGNVIKDERVFPPYTKADFFERITDLCHHTDYIFPDQHDRAYEKTRAEQEMNKHGYGFHQETRDFGRINDHYPEKTVVELPKGEKWIQRAHENDFDDQKEHIDPNRYSLENKAGDTIARIQTDDEDNVETVGYHNKKGLYDRRGSDWKHMPDDIKTKVAALLTKQKLKLNPTQSKDFGYYRTSDGSYKPLKGNKSLEGYFNGKIKFADGHEFRFSRDTWELGVEDISEGLEHWDRWKPYIKVKLDDEGIESVNYLKKSVKRNPKEYMPYIHKLMQIFATVAGDSGDED